MTHSKLSTRFKLGYGAGDFGPALSVQAINFFLLFYFSNILLIPPATAGAILLIGKVWDAITDPLVGYLSDNTKNIADGRRRVYMKWSIIPFGISFFFLWSLGNLFGFAALSENVKSAAALIAFITFSTSITVFNVPYSAMLPELTSDYDERTSLTAYRMAFNILGALVGAGATVILATEGQVMTQKGFANVGLCYGVAIVLGSFVCVTSIRSHCVALSKMSTKKNQTPSFLKMVHEYLSVTQNKPFIPLYIMFFLSTLGQTVVSAILIYFIQDVLQLHGIEAQMPMAILLISSFLSVPIWVKLGKKFDKKTLHMIGLSLLACFVLCIAYTAHLSQFWFYSLIIASGFALTTTFVFNWAMIPDCIEADEIMTGRRREGIYYGVWFFGQKVAMAIGIWLTGIALELLSYKTSHGSQVIQTKQVLNGIRALLGPLPAFFLALSVLALKFYPITKKYYSAMILKISSHKNPL